MERGDIILIVKDPWNHQGYTQFAGETVLVTKVDDDGEGFDFIIPERRGHAPKRFAERRIGHFDLEKLVIKA
jgi:hypothetical protein